MVDIPRPITPEFLAQLTFIKEGEERRIYRLTQEPDKVLKVVKF
jgi:hypothetical protein